MKTQLLTLALFGMLFQNPVFAQDRTTVNATSNEISDNLDLRAVASIFGDSKDLQDFEQRLNDPRNKISNLDLNFDRQVDYLRVIEAVEKNTHLIILQAVLEKDVFQDVATIEVERDRHNQVQIQVVGDVFMYGPNYIYEPVYVTRPIIYNVFWVHNYHPYYSPYYYNYYPSYYYAWTPYPVYRYRRNVHIHINQYNYYNYSTHRRSSNAVALYETRRTNGYERNYENYATRRNNYASTRNESTRNAGLNTKNENSSTRNQSGIQAQRNENQKLNQTGSRNVNSAGAVRNSAGVQPTRSNGNAATRSDLAQTNTSTYNAGSSSTRNNSALTPSNSAENTATRSNAADTPTRNANLSPTRSAVSPQPARQMSQSSNATRSTNNSINRNSSSNSRESASPTRTRSNGRS